MLLLVASAIPKIKFLLSMQVFGIQEFCLALGMILTQLSITVICISILVKANSFAVFYHKVMKLKNKVLRSNDFQKASHLKNVQLKELEKSIKFLVFSATIFHGIVLIYYSVRISIQYSSDLMINDLLTTFFFMFTGYYSALIVIYFVSISALFYGLLTKIHGMIEIKYHQYTLSSNPFLLLLEFREMLQNFSETYGIIFLSVYIFTFATSTSEIFLHLVKLLFTTGDNSVLDYTDFIVSIAWLFPIIFALHTFGSTSSEIENLNQKLMRKLHQRRFEIFKNLKILGHWEVLDNDEVKTHANGLFMLDSCIAFNVSNLLWNLRLTTNFLCVFSTISGVCCFHINAFDSISILSNGSNIVAIPKTKKLIIEFKLLS